MKLFGKDGRAGSHELNITALVTLTVEADGVSIPVVLFVQPDSSQPCLLGMNAAPALGLKFLNAKGQPLRKAVMDRTGSLITCKAVECCSFGVRALGWEPGTSGACTGNS